MPESILSKLQYKEILDGEFTIDFCNDNEKTELYELFLEIIKEGFSYPQTLPYSFQDFLNYFFSQNSKVLICKNKSKKIVGGFYIKPNFPGKSSHVANCGYIVNKEFRGQKIGLHLGKCSIDIAKELGYRSIIFNLVFKENTSAVKLWEKLGFKIIGIIPDAVKKQDGTYMDGYIMYLKLS